MFECLIVFLQRTDYHFPVTSARSVFTVRIILVSLTRLSEGAGRNVGSARVSARLSAGTGLRGNLSIGGRERGREGGREEGGTKLKVMTTEILSART